MARISKVKRRVNGKGRPTNSGSAGMMDWFLAHGELRNANRVGPRSTDVQGYLNFLWPVALDYYSPLNPFFLNEALDLERLNGWPIWMARDGLIPLLWFFKLHPNPGTFNQKILIHEDLAPFAPDAWRHQLGTYQVVSTIQSALPKNRKFLITGLLMDTYVSLRALERQLKGLVERVGDETFAKSEILAFFPPRNEGYGNEHKNEYYSECIFRIAQHLGAHADSIPWRRLDSMDQLEGYEVIEFNERLLCADSYLTQMALFRGARPFGVEANHAGSVPGDQLIRLSPYHGIKIRHDLGGKCLLEHPEEKGAEKWIELFSEAMRSEANKRFPWPNWFAERVQVIEHQRS